jgi:glycosyltransferase involved in cell wall biosynthesis
MEKTATICLNMIVKDESHIIEKTLSNLCDKITFSYWVICDTGSTDNTPELIKTFFKNKNIPGQLFYDKWVNFAHNRTIALEKAFNKTDLLLVFDADDEICGDIVLPSQANYYEYHMKFGTSAGTNYTRVLLINNKKRFQYLSVIHEFITCKEPGSTSTVVDGNYYVISGRNGNRSKDPDKYLKDAQILEEAYQIAFKKDDALYLRYAFYCANSYKDYGRFEDAIKWYKITLGHENQWVQEKYISCLNIYNCYNSLQQPEHGFYYLVEGLNYDKERVECLYPLLVHYCCKNMQNIAYNYYLSIKDTYETSALTVNLDNKLFISPDKNYFFLPYYMILIADKTQDFKCVINMFKIIFIKKYKMFEEWYIKNLLYNLQFFIKHVIDEDKAGFIELANLYIAFIRDNGVNIYNFDFLTTDVYISAGILIDDSFLKEVIVKHNFTENECINSKNILFYTGFTNVHWNYSYILNNAFGGSENAVAYLTKCFPKEYTIFIGGSVLNEQFDNINYVSLNELPNLVKTTPFHTVVVSRYISFYEMFKDCSYYQSYIWAHDTQLLPYGCNLTETQILTKWDKYINGCICLTDWHRNTFIENYPSLKHKIQLINNGIDDTKFNTTNVKIKNRFMYSSRPERGLNALLELWPKIIEQIPDATLIISSYGESDNVLKAIIDKYESIRYLGNLNAENLYKEMSITEYWLYPTTWPETSCITALEMLMSEAICIYYPVAGLVNTMENCGIPIERGNEISTIISLTDDVKKELRENGKKYAKSCSWKNRAEQWIHIINDSANNSNKQIVTTNNANKQVTTNKRVAIFNSFPFHYEMFGFIIHLCRRLHYQLTIFTNTTNDLGWFTHYKNHFKDYNIEIIHYSYFNVRKTEFDIIFITTDDDRAFNKEWINDKCITLDHSYIIRSPEYKYHLSTRPFIENDREWCVPCYKALQINDKQNISTDYISIAIICGNNYYNYKIINRLQSDSKIKLHIISRTADLFNTNNIQEGIEVIIHSNIDTIELVNCLKTCDYILTDCTYNVDHFTGKSMSGSIPLSFSTLTPLIISNDNNALYNFKNIVNFDIDGLDKINITKGLINVELLSEERDQLMLMLDTYLIKYNFIGETVIPETVIPENNTALIIEPRNNEHLFHLINDFKQKLGDTWNIVFYCGKGLKDKWTNMFGARVEVRELEMDNFTINEYSDFMKTTELWKSLYGKYVLTFQADTFILNEPPYTIDYFINMNKSYIGGNMDHGWNELNRENLFINYRNFNGGLSLRKRQDMINIIEHFGTEKTENASQKMQTDAEDVYFTLGCYKLNLPISDNEECLYFCCNRIWVDKCFGFHKPYSQILKHSELLSNIFCSKTNTFIL